MNTFQRKIVLHDFQYEVNRGPRTMLLNYVISPGLIGPLFVSRIETNSFLSGFKAAQKSHSNSAAGWLIPQLFSKVSPDNLMRCLDLY